MTRGPRRLVAAFAALILLALPLSAGALASACDMAPGGAHAAMAGHGVPAAGDAHDASHQGADPDAPRTEGAMCPFGSAGMTQGCSLAPVLPGDEPHVPLASSHAESGVAGQVIAPHAALDGGFFRPPRA